MTQIGVTWPVPESDEEDEGSEEEELEDEDSEEETEESDSESDPEVSGSKESAVETPVADTSSSRGVTPAVGGHDGGGGWCALCIGRFLSVIIFSKTCFHPARVWMDSGQLIQELCNS